jgi:tetratricopeptide (TPR) repeat protein
MIVKNEEAVLARCLSSVSAAVDEIVIVDTGSTDHTKDIAYGFTDRVYDFAWIDDFSAARNFAFSKATTDYLLWLDADDVLERKDLKKLLDLKSKLSAEIDVVYMKYDVAFDENRRPTFSYYRERLIRRCEKAVWLEPVHEAIVPFGKTLYSDIAVTHKKPPSRESGGRNLAIIENQLSQGKQLSPRLCYYYARELMQHREYERAAAVFEALIETPEAWSVHKISACRELYQCKQKGYKKENAVAILYRSFAFGPPEAEILCDIGQHFLDENNPAAAEFWYLAALSKRPDPHALSFVETEYYDFIPLMQLCVIYDRMGNQKLAAEYNEKAGRIKPNSPAYLHNKQYFSNFSK